MMHYSKVIKGLATYIDADILGKLNGSAAKWAAGAAVALALRRADQIYHHQIADNAIVRALGLVDGEDVDVDAIYAELLKQAQQGSATLNVPMLGPVTFTAADVESLYRHIMGA